MVVKVAKATLKLGTSCTSVTIKVDYLAARLDSQDELRCCLVNEKDIGFGFPKTWFSLRGQGCVHHAKISLGKFLTYHAERIYTVEVLDLLLQSSLLLCEAFIILSHCEEFDKLLLNLLVALVLIYNSLNDLLLSEYPCLLFRSFDPILNSLLFQVLLFNLPSTLIVHLRVQWVCRVRRQLLGSDVYLQRLNLLFKVSLFSLEAH